MLCSNPRNRKLSKDLRKLVSQSIGKTFERIPWERTNGGADQRKVSIKYQDVGERMDKLQGKDEHCREERSAVLDSRKSQMLAANLLERLQAQTTASFEESLLDE